ncbi:MAG: Lrp/AsnC family transcriptional regulator [Alphaproteobacteria bacterium]|nr:Lrp/AsnC family transcriptional regulator [Alphaproteobacteria bacterium]
MDRIDLNILKELQQNARITNQELSERVNLSPTPCLRRVKMLEDAGIIKGYSAVVDPDAYGLPVMAFVTVRLERQTDAEIISFEKAVMDLDEVVACYLMSGRQDYMLQVFAHSLKDYENFVRNKLTHVSGLGEMETHFAFGQVKRSMSLPKVNMQP